MQEREEIHMQSEFVFVPSAYTYELEEELARALQARAEIVSHRSNPKLWTRIQTQDGGADASGADEARQKQQRLVNTVLSAAVAIIGALFLAAGILQQNDRAKVSIGLILLVLAAARLMPGSGAAMSRRYHKLAHALLTSLRSVKMESKPKICVNEEGVTISSNQASADYSFSSMETLIETPRLFLLTHSGAATLLQKKDLILGTPEEFQAFFQAHTSCPCAKVVEA